MSTEFYCDMQALTAAQRGRHRMLGQNLHPMIDRVVELPDGYAVEIRASTTRDIEEFMTLEQRCCPFFTLELTTRDNAGEPCHVLRITGEGDIKPFIRAEFRIAEEQIESKG